MRGDLQRGSLVTVSTGLQVQDGGGQRAAPATLDQLHSSPHRSARHLQLSLTMPGLGSTPRRPGLLLLLLLLVVVPGGPGGREGA